MTPPTDLVSGATDATATRLVADTIPYAWPWDGALDPARLALVIAGADGQWFERSHDPVGVRDTIDELASRFRAVGGLVVHVRHAHGAVDPVAQPTPATQPRDLIVTAAGIDGFFGSPLDTDLRHHRRDQLVLVGFGLEGPVHSTMRSGNDCGYECLLLTDACAPLDPACRDAALSMITMSGGIFGALGSSPALLAALDAFTVDPPNPETLP